MNKENAKDRKHPGKVYRDYSKVKKLKRNFFFQKHPDSTSTETKEVVPSLAFESLICVSSQTHHLCLLNHN